jgi:hypothetical protein
MTNAIKALLQMTSVSLQPVPSLIRQRLGEGIIIRVIANELNVSKNTVLLAKEMFVSITRGNFVLCDDTIVNLFVSKPDLNGANLPNLNLNSCHFCPSFFCSPTVLPSLRRI